MTSRARLGGVAITLGALLLASPGHASGSRELLAEAKRLASGHFAEWTYGPRAAKRQVDCVQFLVALLKELRGELPAEARREVLIATIEPDEDLNALVEQEDARIKGVQSALVKRGWGKAIALDEVKPGDLVQYWYPKGKRWLGHSGVIEEVVTRDRDTLRIKLLGAHKSLGKVGTIQVDLRKPRWRVYLVRYTG